MSLFITYKRKLPDGAIKWVGDFFDDLTTFYSEDMQHGMIIDDRLTISNPFLQADTQ